MEGSGVNLGDYMDVVTTYHCKFCSHTCQTVKDMANHVHQDHLSEIVPLPQNSETSNVPQRSKEVGNVMVIS